MPPTQQNEQDRPRIDLATPRDSSGILHLVEEAGWAYTRAEIERLVSVQPEGMLLLRSRGLRREMRGCVYASAWGSLGFIGLMLVKVGHRGKGHGTLLMESALQYLEKEGCTTIGLDAVADAIGFYAARGFKAFWESLRFAVDTSKGAVPKDYGMARRAEDVDLPGIYDLDRRFSGFKRTILLERLARSDDCVMIVAKDGELVMAYGILRRSKGCLRLGPLMAVPDAHGTEAARDILLMAIAETYPRMMTVNVPAYNEEAVDAMAQMGAVHHPSCMRMYMGDPGPTRAPPGIWAMGAAEKG